MRAGAILPKIPDDVMTLVPWHGAGAPPVPTLDDRRVYEIYPGPARGLVDFEGRRLDASAADGRTTLGLAGPPARVTVVWRFQHPMHATLDGRPLEVRRDGASSSVTCPHTAASRLGWW